MMLKSRKPSLAAYLRVAKTPSYMEERQVPGDANRDCSFLCINVLGRCLRSGLQETLEVYRKSMGQ